MTLATLKQHLNGLKTISFQLPDGTLVPEHFHVTEVGKINKNFIDCGGTIRNEEVINFQLWNADDYNHRLHPEKLVHIITLSEKVLGLNENLQIEVEYQGNTIGKYGLDYDGNSFILTSTSSTCLAQEQCGIPSYQKPKISLSELQNQKTNCNPSTGCC